MFWDKKDEKSSLPDLPPAKTQFVRKEETSKNTELAIPEFPDLPKKEDKTEQAVKEIKKEESEDSEIANIPENPRTFKTIEMEEWTPQLPKKVMEVPKAEKEYKKPASFSLTQLPAQDIFVKIEKFRNVRRTLNETKDKLEEIDSLLHKIRETKMREEQELSAWEKEIATAKARIQEVTSSIFEKVE